MRRIAVFAIVIAVAVTLGGLASGSEGGARAGSPITIGYVIGLTGAASSFDVPTWQGAQVAVSDINAAGGVAGHPLKLISVDTTSKFTNGTSGAQQAIEKGAKIIVPSCDYDYGGPAARQGNKQGVLVIACAGDPLMGRTGTGPLTFNIFPPAPAEGADEAQFAIQKGWKRAYELVDTSIQYLEARLRVHGGVVQASRRHHRREGLVPEQRPLDRSAGEPDARRPEQGAGPAPVLVCAGRLDRHQADQGGWDQPSDRRADRRRRQVHPQEHPRPQQPGLRLGRPDLRRGSQSADRSSRSARSTWRTAGASRRRSGPWSPGTPRSR